MNPLECQEREAALGVAAVRRKFGEAVRSKCDTAIRNEVLAKFVAHNVCCCIASWYELGIEPVFAGDDEDRDVLPMRRPG
jgi:hypothetical protein